MIGGSRSGSIPLTYGSGSGSRRPKNMWIRIWIRIRTLLVTGTDLVSEIPEAEDVLLLDLAEDREEGRLQFSECFRA
jgi:hypothetical protein